MVPDREEIISSQLALLKKKERQQSLIKRALLLGGLAALVGIFFFVQFLLGGSSNSQELAPVPPHGESISVEEITIPAPLLKPQVQEELPTSVARYSSHGNGDSLDYASDTTTFRR